MCECIINLYIYDYSLQIGTQILFDVPKGQIMSKT